jgi:2-dehydro-3-deoxygalactonokinase
MNKESKNPAAFIAGDWGTSNLRLTLCDADGQALDMRKGPGAADSRGKHAEIFDGLVAEWTGAHGALPAVLSGMVGSTIGWLEVPYLPCPAELYELAEDPARAACLALTRSGFRCTKASSRNS